ncbi:MAG: nucleoside triphosphate pyrophosphohydrolase [Desulfonatronovibrio sp.]
MGRTYKASKGRFMKHDEGINHLINVINKLLSPEGCPWDREQTPESLCDYLLEESFELAGAVRSGDAAEVREEMGDVFFLLFFIAHLYKDKFSLDDVWHTSAAKMISRHPHVFDNESFETREDLLRNWEKIKKEEKKGKDQSPFSSIPRSLPPLLMAYRINSKAARAGFTWDTEEAVEEKLKEEWQEFMQARETGDSRQVEQEFGDYLFTLVEFGRRNKIKANSALSLANNKFLDRVKKMEALALERNMDISSLDMEEMDALWDEVKAAE